MNLVKKITPYLQLYFFILFSHLVYGGNYSAGHANGMNIATDWVNCNDGTTSIRNIELTMKNRNSVELTFDWTSAGTNYSYSGKYSNSASFSTGATSVTFGDVFFLNCTFQSVTNNAYFRVRLEQIPSSLSSREFTTKLTITIVGAASSNPQFVQPVFGFQGVKPKVQITSRTGLKEVCGGDIINVTVSGDDYNKAELYLRLDQGGGGLYKIINSSNDFTINDSFQYIVPQGGPEYNGLSFWLLHSYGVTLYQDALVYILNPIPSNLEIKANKDFPLCKVEPITLNIPGYSTVTWPDGGPTINNPENKSYRAIVQKRVNGIDVCPSVEKRINVSIFTFNPTINEPLTTIKCQGEAIDLTANSGGSGSFSYSWTKADGTPIGGNSQKIEARDAGQYRVTVTPQPQVCGPKTVTSSFSLNFATPIPDQDISPSKANRLICGAPDETSMQLTANPEGVSYNWRREGGGGLGNSRSISVSQGGRYVVDMERGACSRSKIIDVQENSYDRNIAPVSAITFCADAPITLSANSNDANRFDYVWKKDGMNVGSNSPSYQTNVGGTFTVSITAKNTGCSPKTSDAVAVVASMPISDEAIALPAMKERPILCGAPDEPSIVLTAVQTDVSYNWQGPGVSNATQKTLTITQAGEYTLNMVRGACSKQKKITVEPNTYDTNIATAPPAFCAKTPITLRANSNDAAKFDYAWKRNGMAVGSNTPTLLLTNEVGSFKYTVEITSKGTGCKSKTSAEVSINTDRAITGAKITLPAGKERAIICGDPENTIVLTAVADIPTDGIAFNWQGPSTGMANTLSAAQAGDYKVSFDRGTCQEEATVKVESGVFVPSISATGTIVNSANDLRICNGETSTITANISGTNIPNTVSNFTYRWFGGADANTEITNQKGQTLPAVVAGTYRLEMTLTGSGCPKKDAPQRIKIAVDPAIKNPRITPNPAIICNKANGLTITALTDSSAGISYRWSGGGRSDSDPTKYIVSNAGNYSVTFSRGACQGQASVSPREEELKIDVAAPFMSNPIIVCEGSNSAVPVELKATANLSTATIKWMRNNGEEAPTPNTGGTYLPKQSGQYYATANFDNICNATSPQKVPIEALTNFSISISPSNPAPLCDDRPINLTPVLSHAAYRDIYSYEWLQDGKNVKAGIGAAGNTLSTGKVVDYPNNTLVLGNESNYVVKITKDGCKAESAVSKITLKPARSTITVLDINTLEASTSGDAKYEWYYKNTRASSFADSLGYQLLPNFTARTLLGADIGSYYVRANRNGCGIKNSFTHYVSVITASSSTFVNEWLVYPNPAVESIVIENQAKPNTPVEVRFWDSWGRELQHFSQDRTQERYSVGHLPAGVYYVEIKEECKTSIRKILKK